MKKLLLVFVLSMSITLFGFCGVGAVSAQESEAQEEESASQEEDTEEEFTLEEVIVTGSNISGVGAAIGSQTIVLDSTTLQNTVAFDIADVMQTLPQVQRMVTSDDNGTGTITGGKSINLRGIGTNATLVMVDGNRITPGGTAIGFQEAVQVPMAALEQVEVVTDGLSSVYGSDAISGVVNYIMRKDYEGAEVRASYTTNSRGVNEWSTSILGGTSWKKLGGFGQGNIIVSYEHSSQDQVLKSKFPGLRQDLTPLGGNDNRLNGSTASVGTPGNIVVDNGYGSENPDLPAAGQYTYYGLPAGTDGVGLTVDDLLLNQPNIVDTSTRNSYRPESKTDYFTLYLNQEIKDYLEVYVQAYYTHRKTWEINSSPAIYSTVNMTIDPDNPNWIPDIPGTSTPIYDWANWDGISWPPPILGYEGSITFQYDWYGHIGPFTRYGENKTLSATAGAKFRMPADWNGDVKLSYGYDKGCGVCDPDSLIVGDAWNELLASGEINPFSSEPLSQDIIDQILGDNLQMNDNRRLNADIKFDGPLFHLPAGYVKAAVGYQYSEDTNNLLNGAHRENTDEFIWDADTDTIREQNSIFAELYIPVVGKDSNIPLLQKIDFTASVRQDKYDNSYKKSLDRFVSSSFEDTNPRFGMNWEIDDNIRLRGAWSTSFRAPSIPETDPGVFSMAMVLGVPNGTTTGEVPVTGTGWMGPESTALARFGGNEDLGPENGETWSVGFDFTPSFWDRFKLSGTYYRVSYEDKIAGSDWYFALYNDENAAIYQDLWIPVTQVAGCDNYDESTWPEEIQEWWNVLYKNPVDNMCEVVVLMDGRSINKAGTFQDGIDIQLSYGFNTSIGYFNIDLNVNKIFKNEEQTNQYSPVTDNLDHIGDPISLRGRGNIGLYNDSWSGNLYVNYVGSYTNDQPITVAGVQLPVSKVPSWTTFDLNLRYLFKESSIPGLSDLTLSVSVKNLLDKDPPIVLTGTSAYDAINHDIMGRTFQFSLIKEF